MYSHGLWDGLGTSGTRVGMEWTRDKTLELLREYQQRRVLWDWNARGYRDRAKRKRAIQELAEILCCNTLEVEKKITNLKCQYSREVHKIQNSRDAATGPDDVYVSKWFAFKAMQFLQFGTRRYSKRKKVGRRGRRRRSANPRSRSSVHPPVLERFLMAFQRRRQTERSVLDALVCSPRRPRYRGVILRRKLRCAGMHTLNCPGRSA